MAMDVKPNVTNVLTKIVIPWMERAWEGVSQAGQATGVMKVGFSELSAYIYIYLTCVSK